MPVDAASDRSVRTAVGTGNTVTPANLLQHPRCDRSRPKHIERHHSCRTPLMRSSCPLQLDGDSLAVSIISYRRALDQFGLSSPEWEPPLPRYLIGTPAVSVHGRSNDDSSQSPVYRYPKVSNNAPYSNAGSAITSGYI